MKLKFLRDESKEFPSVDNALDVFELTVWYCKYKTLSSIKELFNLKELVIAGVPDKDLSFLEGLKSLERLSILHMPKVTELSPIASLTNLEYLSLSTLPSWDSSNKKLIVDSLLPISSLQKLKHIELLGVVSKDKSLRELYGCTSIIGARISKYPKKEIDDFYFQLYKSTK